MKTNSYSVKTDKRSGTVNDPNRAKDPQYIVRQIGKMADVGLKTAEIVVPLPELWFGEGEFSLNA